MKLISWNINSVRLRMPLIGEFIKEQNPDILCLQELKTQDEFFPLQEFKDLGYDYVEFSGEKSYNGVAIISKLSLKNVETIDIHDYGHKRHIKCDIETKAGSVEIHNFYIPAGGDIADVETNPKFDHKLKFVDYMNEFFTAKKEQNLIIAGDFNIAPLENDVWSHKQLLKVVSHTPIEVEKLTNLQQSAELTDSHRLLIPETEKLYSWWSYRGKEPFKSNRGRRLDHIWTSKSLKSNISDVATYSDYRIKEKPSDHVPIATMFDL